MPERSLITQRGTSLATSVSAARHGASTRGFTEGLLSWNFGSFPLYLYLCRLGNTRVGLRVPLVPRMLATNAEKHGMPSGCIGLSNALATHSVGRGCKRDKACARRFAPQTIVPTHTGPPENRAESPLSREEWAYRRRRCTGQSGRCLVCSEVGAAPAGAEVWLVGTSDRGGLRAMAGCPVNLECVPGPGLYNANL